MISRTLVIVLAFGVAVVRASQGAWVETMGLTALGAGLVLLHVARTRPAAKTLAWMCFALTAASMIVVFVRDWL